MSYGEDSVRLMFEGISYRNQTESTKLQEDREDSPLRKLWHRVGASLVLAAISLVILGVGWYFVLGHPAPVGVMVDGAIGVVIGTFAMREFKQWREGWSDRKNRD